MTKFTRRALIGAAAATVVARPAISRAQTRPKALEELAAIAAKKPPVVWTESSEVGAIGQVIAAFHQTWPDIKVDYIRDTGGNTLAAKVVQEAQAGGAPAAVLTGDAQQFQALDQRGLLVHPDWKALGVADNLIGSPFMVATTAALGVLVWNTKNVSEADRPKTLDDLLQAKYTGKVGSWIRAPEFVSLAAKMGEANVRSLLEKLLASQPRLYDSTYRLAQEAATGEIDVGYGLWHAAQPTIAAGGPIKVALTEPMAVSTIFSCVVAKAANPEGGQALAAWLTTPDGANAYESATGRGNPYVKGTKTAQLVEGYTLSEYPLAELPTQIRLQTEFNRMLSSRGAAK